MNPCRNCPDPDLCKALKKHLVARLYDIWRGRDDSGLPILTPYKCHQYRMLWIERAGIDPEQADALIRKHRGGSVALPVITACIHRGDKTRIEKCTTCGGGGWSAVLYQCAIHGECSLYAKPIEGAMQCPCPDQVIRAKPFVRNLIYYIHPERRNGMWQWNVKQLLKRIDQFNGKRIVAIAWSARCSPLDDVKAAFEGKVDEFLDFTNKFPTGEVVAFRSLLEKVKSTDENDITFYAHAKGVMKQTTEYSRLWGGAMYDVCLDYPDLVDGHLSQYGITGAFRAYGGYPVPKQHNWHYAGTFYWFRNSAVFSKKNWGNIAGFYGGTEAWPGGLFTNRESGCLFGDGKGGGRLYDPAIWKTHVTPELNEWKKHISAL